MKALFQTLRQLLKLLTKIIISLFVIAMFLFVIDVLFFNFEPTKFIEKNQEQLKELVLIVNLLWDQEFYLYPSQTVYKLNNQTISINTNKKIHNISNILYTIDVDTIGWTKNDFSLRWNSLLSLQWSPNIIRYSTRSIAGKNPRSDIVHLTGNWYHEYRY